MDATIYAMRISHPAQAAELMLAHKGIEAKRVEVPPASQRVLMRRYGFKGGTVPGLKLDGRRIQGTREIARALEIVQPEPRLFPEDQDARDAVETAELWGEQSYQPVPRRIFRWAMSANGELRTRMTRSMGAPVPGVSQWALWPVTLLFARSESGGQKAARRDVADLPSHLDKVDRWISEGTIDGEDLNAADFQIGTTTRVLLNFSELRPMIEGRPAADHAMRVVPKLGREAALGLPAAWLPASS